MSRQSHLYLCSSMRHAYLAMGLAVDTPDIDHHLIFVGQSKKKINTTINLFIADNRPFASVDVYRDDKGLTGKYRSKKAAFNKLEKIVDRLNPAKVFAGNDRRVEFQYAMYYCQSTGLDATGAYLDDGTASYINGRYLKRRRTITDLTIDRALKRLFYGSWYDKHRLMGGTRWVQDCYLNFPQLAPPGLHKNIIELTPKMFRNENFLLLAKRLVNAVDEQDVAIFEKHYDAFLTLPLSKFVRDNFPSPEYYSTVVNKYLSQFKSVAVKYHPRETDFYYKNDADITIFPAEIPAEVIFSFVKVECVVGDLSSALLSAVWLLPDSKAICLCPESLNKSPIVEVVKQTPVKIEYC